MILPVFLTPWLLLALAGLPAIWWLLRALPPQPQRIYFPATRILKGLAGTQVTPNHTPWWLTALRMLAAALTILAFAEPVLNPQSGLLPAGGPVVLVIDNDWAAAARWSDRMDQAKRLIEEAGRTGQNVVLVTTVRDMRAQAPRLMSPKDAQDALTAIMPLPIDVDRTAALASLDKVSAGLAAANIFWLSDGLATADAATFATRLLTVAGAKGQLAVLEPRAGAEALGLTAGVGEGGALEFRVLRTGGPQRDVTVEALSSANQPLSETTVSLGSGSSSQPGRIDIPLELRNQVARLAVRAEPSAGAVQLMDAGSRWNRIGLVTGAARETLQPLLGQLYYVERALKPFAQLTLPQDNDADTGIAKLVDANVSMLVLADVGKIVGPAKTAVAKFLTRGGVLVRFAGPRLEDAGDDLLPVDLRSGERSLGGALSWSTPQPLGAFEADSPFSGLAIAPDIRITRQVLADPALLSDRTRIWARLADGTPLVTAEKRGGGWIVLFHVTANSEWSNLPLSGLFVDMLRRITQLTGRSEMADAASNAGTLRAAAAGLLPALATLDAYGALGTPSPVAEPLAQTADPAFRPDATHPPGLYGAGDVSRALNVLPPHAALLPLSGLPAAVSILGYERDTATRLKPFLLAGALALLLADMAAVLLLQTGRLHLGRANLGRAIAVALGLSIASFSSISGSKAAAPDADAFGLRASLSTHLAYVITGDAETDLASKQGLAGLNQVLLQRTAVESGDPIGVHVDKDDLTFFPVLYWPVTKAAQTLDEPTRARVAAYMKSGGLIVFDTRDEGDRMPGAGGTPGNAAFQRLAANLDVPRLEQVPPGHVLTKSFYLLKSFPGRYESGPMWVEAGTASSAGGAAAGSAASASDGVSSVIVTGNDLAGSWASDENGNGLYAVIPGGEEQREMAYRVGVNIVMYALTGSYKADQVHVNTIIERLGQ